MSRLLRDYLASFVNGKPLATHPRTICTSELIQRILITNLRRRRSCSRRNGRGWSLNGLLLTNTSLNEPNRETSRYLFPCLFSENKHILKRGLLSDDIRLTVENNCR